MKQIQKPDNMTLLQQLKQLLKTHFHEKIRDVILFGSRAKGTAHEYSDYDVLIVLNGGYDWKFRDKIIDVVYDMELEYDVLFDKFVISTDELQHSSRGAQPIFTNAIQNGVYA
jgi:predicted nucleotidyltransferase